MDVRVACLLVLVAVTLVCSVPVEKGGPNRDEQFEGGPIIIVETGAGNSRRNRPFMGPFWNPFFDNDDEEDDDFGGSFNFETRAEDVPVAPPSPPVRPSIFGGFGAPDFGGFGGFGIMNRMSQWMQDMQKQMNRVWERVYRQHANRFGSGAGSGSSGDKYPPNYHNSTATTKVVNGSVVTVNETVHKSGDNDSMSFYHFKIVHVRPEDNPSDQRTPGNGDKSNGGGFEQVAVTTMREREELNPNKGKETLAVRKIVPSPDEQYHVMEAAVSVPVTEVDLVISTEPESKALVKSSTSSQGSTKVDHDNEV